MIDRCPALIRRPLLMSLATCKTALALLGAVVWAAGCAAPRPYYSGFRFGAPTLVETDRSEMVMYLDWVLKSNRGLRRGATCRSCGRR